MTIASLRKRQERERRIKIERPIVAIWFSYFCLFFLGLIALDHISDEIWSPASYLSIWGAVFVSGLILAFIATQLLRKFWLYIQAKYIQEWLTETFSVDVLEKDIQISSALMTKNPLIVKNFSFIKNGQEYDMALFNEQVGDKKELNFIWYTKVALKQEIKGLTYLVAESDFSHILFKQFETRTTLLEWNDFEDLLHVETTDEIEARYLLPPDVMEKLYDIWKKHNHFWARMRFKDSMLEVVVGIKETPAEAVSHALPDIPTLLHNRGPIVMEEAFMLAQSLSNVIPLHN